MCQVCRGRFAGSGKGDGIVACATSFARVMTVFVLRSESGSDGEGFIDSLVFRCLHNRNRAMGGIGLGVAKSNPTPYRTAHLPNAKWWGSFFTTAPMYDVPRGRVIKGCLFVDLWSSAYRCPPLATPQAHTHTHTIRNCLMKLCTNAQYTAPGCRRMVQVSSIN